MKIRYFSQRDNLQKPWSSCYNTSMAMVVDYILKKNNKTKRDIKCPPCIQLEDYLFDLIYTEGEKWLKKNINRIGTWALQYRPQTLAAVECYIFNFLMKERFGYEAKFLQNQSLESIQGLIDENDCPQVIHGNFYPETKVRGHIVVAIKTCGVMLQVNDPYGHFYSNYNDHNGERIYYHENFFKRRKKSIWVTSIIKKSK